MEKLYIDVKYKIETGIYKINSKLPSIRKSALFYNVNNYIIFSVYDRLYKEGFVNRIQGKGYFVISSCGKYFKPKGYSSTATNTMGILYKNFFKNNTYRNIINNMFYNSLKKMYFTSLESFLYNNSGIGRPDLRMKLSNYLSSYLGIDILPDDIVLSSSKDALIEYLYKKFNKKYIVLENPTSKHIKSFFDNKNFNVKYADISSEDIFLRDLPKSPSILYIETYDQFPTGNSYSFNCKKNLGIFSKEHEYFILENLYRKDFLFEKQDFIYGMENVFLIGDMSQIFPESIRFAFLVKPRNFDIKDYNSNISSLTEEFLLTCFNNGSLERALTKLWIFLKEIRDEFILVLNRKKIHYKCLSCGPYIVLEINGVTTEEKIIDKLKFLEVDISPEFFYLKNGRILFSFMYTDVKINKISKFIDYILQ